VTTEAAQLSSLEKILLGLDQPVAQEVKEPLREGSKCPQCGQAQLAYNGLLQLECPACGFINADGGACT
jgi:uncharacterized protein (DUF983 family)